MSCTTEDLMRKEVINICTAQSLGCIKSFEVDMSCGRITSIITSSGKGLFSFLSDCEVCVPWEKIVRVGDDVILVDLTDNECCDKRRDGDDGGRKTGRRF